MAYQYPDQIWLLGDSMTQMSFAEDGLAARFADIYARKFDVINRGYSGYNSRWDAIVFKQIFPTLEQRIAQHLPIVRLLTIWLGTNDCVEAGRPQYLSPEELKQEISSIIAVTRERSPETRIVLITPAPQQIARLEKNFYLPHDPPIKIDRSNEQVELYVRATKELGEKDGVPVVNAWDPMWKAAGSKDEDALEPFYCDGLHLGSKGYKIVWDELLQMVKTNFPELHPDKVKMDFCRWDAVDHVHPERALQRGEY